MTTCNVELLQKAFEQSPENAKGITTAINSVVGFSAKAGRFNPVYAQQWIDWNKNQHLDHRLSKYTRPWEIVNLTSQLDKDQPWVGIEYETGYANKAAYQRVINFLWQNIPWTAIDIEGGGRYPCEITFSPVNMNDFMSDDYHMDRLLKFMNGDGDAAKNGDGVYVGTHLNASTPAYRTMPDSKVTEFNQNLRQLLRMIGKGNNVPLFGRLPYGYNHGMGYGNTKWIEFKLFKSTGDMDTWQKYKSVMARLIQAIEYFARDTDALPPANIDAKGKPVPYPQDEDYCMIKSNFADYLLGNFDNLAQLKVEYAKRSTTRSYQALEQVF